VSAWEAARVARLDPAGPGPRRAGWPDLAMDRTPLGWDTSIPKPARAAAAPGEPPADPVAGRALSESESLARLAAAGIPTTRSVDARDADAAVAAWRAFGGPVAVKLHAPGLAHKSDVGGVALNLDDEAAVRAAAARLLRVAASAAGNHGASLLVQPMAPAGVELIVGARRDPQVGPLVLVGLGGVLAEARDDVVVALAPLDAGTATALLGRLRGARLLDGFRGGPTVDRSTVGALVAAVGRLLAEDETIVEIDVNPVIAGPDGALAVDALVVIRGETPG
jgi:succinyl-CoA synthetase beta subunit